MHPDAAARLRHQLEQADPTAVRIRAELLDRLAGWDADAWSGATLRRKARNLPAALVLTVTNAERLEPIRRVVGAGDHGVEDGVRVVVGADPLEEALVESIRAALGDVWEAELGEAWRAVAGVVSRFLFAGVVPPSALAA